MTCINLVLKLFLILNINCRAQSVIAKRLGICVSNVKNVTIWGNHSSTQFPDVYNASIQSSDKSVDVYSSINDSKWLEGDFIKVRKCIHSIKFY